MLNICDHQIKNQAENSVFSPKMKTFETTLFLGGELNFDYSCLQTINGTYAVVAEWLRRWTRNPLGSARTGSNPVGSEGFMKEPH